MNTCSTVNFYYIYTIIVCHDKLVSRIEIGLMTESLCLEQHMQLSSRVHQFSCSQGIYSCGHQLEK